MVKLICVSLRTTSLNMYRFVVDLSCLHAIIVTICLSHLSVFFFYIYQRAKKVLSGSPGLVDFAIGLANSVFNLPDGQVMF